MTSFRTLINICLCRNYDILQRYYSSSSVICCIFVSPMSSSSSCSDPVFLRFDFFKNGLRYVSRYVHLRECFQNLRRRYHKHHRSTKLFFDLWQLDEIRMHVSRLWHLEDIDNEDQEIACKTGCVRADEYASRLHLKRRLIRLDDSGHVLSRDNFLVAGHRGFHQTRHTGSHNYCEIRRFLKRSRALFTRSVLQNLNCKLHMQSLILDGRHHDLRAPVIDGDLIARQSP